MIIGEMPLYATIERFRNELRSRRLGTSSPLSPDQLFPFDQIHYQGTDAVQRAIDALQLDATHHVVEIGAGVGGPARYLAHMAQCRVTAVELQPGLHELATSLTARCGLADRVQHQLGDALTCDLPQRTFDAAVSWLAIHHIPERPRLLSRMARSLRPGGRLYVEDLYARAAFSVAELLDVDRLLYGVTMTPLEQYRDDLAFAGFTDIDMTDTTEEWGPFCAGRASSWRESRDRQLQVHGEATFDALDRFFSGVSALFAGGHLGGVRMTARAAN